MISKSDAAVVRSLLRKTQAISRQLAEDADANSTKRIPARDRAQMIKLMHCYLTVAIRYMLEEQSS